MSGERRLAFSFQQYDTFDVCVCVCFFSSCVLLCRLGFSCILFFCRVRSCSTDRWLS